VFNTLSCFVFFGEQINLPFVNNITSIDEKFTPKSGKKKKNSILILYFLF